MRVRVYVCVFWLEIIKNVYKEMGYTLRYFDIKVFGDSMISHMKGVHTLIICDYQEENR